MAEGQKLTKTRPLGRNRDVESWEQQKQELESLDPTIGSTSLAATQVRKTLHAARVRCDIVRHEITLEKPGLSNAGTK